MAGYTSFCDLLFRHRYRRQSAPEKLHLDNSNRSQGEEFVPGVAETDNVC